MFLINKMGADNSTHTARLDALAAKLERLREEFSAAQKEQKQLLRAQAKLAEKNYRAREEHLRLLQVLMHQHDTFVDK